MAKLINILFNNEDAQYSVTCNTALLNQFELKRKKTLLLPLYDLVAPPVFILCTSIRNILEIQNIFVNLHSSSKPGVMIENI